MSALSNGFSADASFVADKIEESVGLSAEEPFLVYADRKI